MPAPFRLFFVFFVLFFALVVVLAVVGAVRRYRAAKQAGLDPWAADVQVMGAVRNSAALAPERPMQERLAEVEQLYAAGTIDAAERQRARDRILGG